MKQGAIRAGFLSAILLCACGRDAPATPTAPAPDASTIDPARARELLAQDTRVVLLDVRTREEHEESRIPGSLLLPHDRIRGEAARVLPDTTATILTYCRSGRRSRAAAEELRSLGYVAVQNLGGIQDWPYEVETGP